MSRSLRAVVVLVALGAAVAAAALAEPQAPPATNPDPTTLDADGTARVTRVVPVPTTISPEAQALLATGASWAPAEGSKEQGLHR
jgi:monoterpene epsilon-lactone hydrolase